MHREGGHFKSITRGMHFVPGICLLKSGQSSPLPGIFPCDSDTSPTALQHSLQPPVTEEAEGGTCH